MHIILQTITILLLTTVVLRGQGTSPNPMVVTLRVDVDQLRLRAAPDKAAEVVATLPQHTQLRYLDQTAGTWDEITLRGQPHRARWYKVQTAEEPIRTGWVYGGAVVLSSVYLATKGEVPALQYDFLTLEQVSRQQYEAARKAYVDPIMYDTLQHQQRDSTLILPLDTLGKTARFVSQSNEENTEIYNYTGQIPAIRNYIVEGLYYEYNEYILIDQRNGRMVKTQGFPEDLPRLSPDQKTLAAAWSDVYESNGGVQILSVLPDGVFDTALLAIEGVYFGNVCWGADGSIYLSSYLWSDAMKGKPNVHQYHRLRLVPR
jgi:Bacterial SH3 domain